MHHACGLKWYSFMRSIAPFSHKYACYATTWSSRSCSWTLSCDLILDIARCMSIPRRLPLFQSLHHGSMVWCDFWHAIFSTVVPPEYLRTQCMDRRRDITGKLHVTCVWRLVDEWTVNSLGRYAVDEASCWRTLHYNLMLYYGPSHAILSLGLRSPMQRSSFVDDSLTMHNAETLGLRMVLVMAVVDYGDCYYTFVMGRPCGWLSLRLFYSWMTLAILVCSNWNTTCAWAKSFLRSSNILFLDNSCYFWRPILAARPYWQFRNSLCVHDCPNHD